MSAQSSSAASWTAQDGRPADIIDLDKFMRGGVRPSRPETRLQSDQLVVDGGGASRKPASTVVACDASSSGSSARPKPHAKRFSHDSGLSDGSYARRKHRPHRRPAIGESGTRNREMTSARTPANRGSSHSFRAFRTVCKRALLDQQQQIARVAELCERLTVRRAEPRRERTTTDSSDVSSSSRSTKDLRRKDKHRIDECKTYKIIMTKLDELNRLFAARAQAPRALPAPAAARAPPLPPSSGSVSVSDKLVSTEPELQRPNTQGVHRCGTPLVERGDGGARRAAGRGARLRAVTNTCDLDIAPCDALPNRTRPNVATESVVANSARGSGTSACDARFKFDLEDPIRLYSQTKRLQDFRALPATTRRSRSVDLLTDRLANKFDGKLEERFGERRRKERETTLCALCRGYWRAFRHYFNAQVFGCN